MRRVLLFGGSGFLGRALRARLEQGGFTVGAPAHAAAPLQDSKALFDVVSAFAPDIAINLAGISAVSHQDYLELYELNAFGHLHVLEACVAAAPGARVFLASTANVYGQNPAESLSERAAPAPVSHYAISKVAAEHFNALFADRLSVCTVRLFNCIGRGQGPTFVVPKLVDAFRRRVPRLELGDISARRDYVDVRDACAMWEVLLAQPSPPPLVNFGRGNTTSVREIVDSLERMTGHALEIVHDAHLLRAREIASQRADPSVITALGFRPRYSLEETLAWMLAENGG
jgi:nucleoside-diphosphate-sugar epimerase